MFAYCPGCKSVQPPTARFCSNCGAAIPMPATIPARPLMRPLVGRRLAGVCIALSLAYGWDIALVRILAVVGLFFSCGLVSVIYLACWIGIPEEPLPLP